MTGKSKISGFISSLNLKPTTQKKLILFIRIYLASFFPMDTIHILITERGKKMVGCLDLIGSSVGGVLKGVWFRTNTSGCANERKLAPKSWLSFRIYVLKRNACATQVVKGPIVSSLD